jgi:hypothetical protein
MSGPWKKHNCKAITSYVSYMYLTYIKYSLWARKIPIFEITLLFKR